MYAVPTRGQGSPAITVLYYCMPLFRNYSEALQNPQTRKGVPDNGKCKERRAEEAPDP